MTRTGRAAAWPDPQVPRPLPPPDRQRGRSVATLRGAAGLGTPSRAVGHVPPSVLLGVRSAARRLAVAGVGQDGGDWTELMLLPDGALGVVIGDVMGHDTIAAAGMRRLRSLTRSSLRAGRAPSSVLDRLDDAVQRELSSPLATVFCARMVVDRDGALLLYSNAGHPPPLLRTPDGTVSRLSGALSPLVGAPSGARGRGEAAVCLPVDSLLLLYTDGLLDCGPTARHRDLDESIDSLGRLLAASRPDEPLDALCEAAVATLPPPRTDDVAVLALRIVGSSAR